MLVEAGVGRNATRLLDSPGQSIRALCASKMGSSQFPSPNAVGIRPDQQHYILGRDANGTEERAQHRFESIVRCQLARQPVLDPGSSTSASPDYVAA